MQILDVIISHQNDNITWEQIGSQGLSANSRQQMRKQEWEQKIPLSYVKSFEFWQNWILHLKVCSGYNGYYNQPVNANNTPRISLSKPGTPENIKEQHSAFYPKSLPRQGYYVRNFFQILYQILALRI